MNKTTWLTVRISEEELIAIKQKAQKANLSVSEFVRIKCTCNESLPSINVDRNVLTNILIALKREGNNLNQLTRYIHSKKMDSASTVALRAALSEVSNTAQILSQFLIEARRQL